MSIENKEEIATACRIEYEEKTGKLYIVFEVTNPRYVNLIKTNWTQDIEYRIIDKKLYLEK
ncbi:MAG: hypothetical protein EB127_29715 [Alphaproteobacteria bacterium]|nr:hypothetical protein [Alphaproteobacteria bacterium]